MTPARGVYRITDVLVQWMSTTLLDLQEGTFRKFRQAFTLLKIVQAAEEGRIIKWAALNAIQNFNREHNTSFTYDDIRDLDSTFIFSDAGEWVVFSDNPRDIICGEHDAPELALAYAPESVKIILVWEVEADILIVYRSPYIEGRVVIEELDGGVVIAHGESRGDYPTFVLPPEVEASLHEMEPGELFRQ